MAYLKHAIEAEEEHEFTLRTTHFLRPHLKQIKDSLYQIKDHFVKKDGVCFVPKTLVSHLKKVKENLLERLKKDSFLFKTDIISRYDIKNCEHGRAFVFMTESLGPVLDVPLKRKSDNIVCDVFLAMPHQPLMVLTIVDGDVCADARRYNTHLMSSFTHRLHRFNDEGVYLIHGVLTRGDIKTDKKFKDKIEQCAKSSSFFFNLNLFSMDPAKFERILLSFWAAVAETNSVKPKDNGAEGSFVRFLTKEQCIVLVENIDQEKVEVTCGPATGSTTLMLEVARRLSRIGSTLLVCQPTEEEKKISDFHHDGHIIVVKESVPENLAKFCHVIDATNTVAGTVPGRLWRFIKDKEDDMDSIEVADDKGSKEETKKEEVALKEENPELPKGSAHYTGTESDSIFPSEEKYKEQMIKEKASYSKANPHMVSGTMQPEEDDSSSPVSSPKYPKFSETKQKATSCQVVKDQELHSSSKTPGFHVLFTGGRYYHSRVESPKMIYSAKTVFKDLQVKKEIDLVNYEKSGQHDKDQLKLLEGVYCDPSPLSSGNSNIVYMETHTMFKTLTGWAGVAMGVCEKGSLDSHKLLSRHERNWCVCVGTCKKHGGLLCSRVWEEQGKQVGDCCQHTQYPKKPPKGSKSVMRLAMVLKMPTGRIGFIDLNCEKVLYKFDCVFRDTLCPVFSISTSPDVSRRTMTLVTGSDVVFTDTKKSLICEALSD